MKGQTAKQLRIFAMGTRSAKNLVTIVSSNVVVCRIMITDKIDNPCLLFRHCPAVRQKDK